MCSHELNDKIANNINYHKIKARAICHGHPLLNIEKSSVEEKNNKFKK